MEGMNARFGFVPFPDKYYSSAFVNTCTLTEQWNLIQDIC